MLVLIIDDDSEDCELFREALSEIDATIKCLSVRDGREAISLLTDGLIILPDFIFLDINMPIINGRECLKAIKQNSRLKEIPVIMYSTTSDTKEIQSYYQLGAHDFLIKPHNFKKLVEALNSIIPKDGRSVKKIG